MTAMSDKVRRLWQIIELVARQDEHLQGVRRRLFGAMNPEAVNGDWVARTLASAEGIDRIESFGAKFARMQDTVMDKLLPQFLAAVGEKPGTAIDNLNRAERLTLVRNADDWLAMRRLRNRLVHEYIDEPKEMAPALQRVRTFTDELHRTYAAIRDYAASHLESG